MSFIDERMIYDENGKRLSNKIGVLSNLQTQTKDSLVGAVNEHAAQLAQITNEVHSRKFNPKIGKSPYWGEASDNVGGTWLKSLNGMKSDIDEMKEGGLDEFPVIIHIAFNENTNEFYIVENLSDISSAIEYAQTQGINPKCVKIHRQRITEENVNSYGMTGFKTKWKEFVTTIGELFKPYNIPYLTVINETDFITMNTEHTPFILELFTIAKNMGYKTGITTLGVWEFSRIPEEIKLGSDAFFINCYPKISARKQATTYQDSVQAWNLNTDIRYIKSLKSIYNKPVIISESGVMDYWICLANPGKWDWDESILGNPSDGKVSNIYLKGMLENLKDTEEIESIWLWYDIYFPINNEMIKSYTGRGDE